MRLMLTSAFSFVLCDNAKSSNPSRAFIFEADTAEYGKHFLMSGIPGHNCIPKMQKLEQDTGIPLKLVVLSGDFHHMAMKYWLEGTLSWPDSHLCGRLGAFLRTLSFLCIPTL